MSDLFSFVEEPKCSHSWTMNDGEGEINIPVGETVRSTYLRIWWGCSECMAEQSISYAQEDGVWMPIQIKTRANSKDDWVVE